MTQEEKVIHIDTGLYNTILPSIKTQLESQGVVVPNDSDLMERISLIANIKQTKLPSMACVNVGSATIRGYRPLASNGEYLYGVTQSDNGPLIKISKNTLTEATRSSINYGGAIMALVIDDTYIYVGGLTSNSIWRFLKSNLSFVDATDYGGAVYALYVDNNYVYALGPTALTLKRYNKSTMAYIDSVGSFNATYNVYSIFGDNTYLFVINQNKLYKINKSTFIIDGFVTLDAYYAGTGTIYNNKIYANTRTSLLTIINYDTLEIEYADTTAWSGTCRAIIVIDNVVYSFKEYTAFIDLDNKDVVYKGGEINYGGGVGYDSDYIYTMDGYNSNIAKYKHSLYIKG